MNRVKFSLLWDKLNDPVFKLWWNFLPHVWRKCLLKKVRH